MPPSAEQFLRGFNFHCEDYAGLQLVGSVGAMIMPHNLYLHSGICKQRLRLRNLTARAANPLLLCSFFLHAFIAFCGGHDGLPNVQALPTGRMWSMSGKPTSTQQFPGRVVGQRVAFSESNLNPKMLPKSVFSYSSSKILLPL